MRFPLVLFSSPTAAIVRPSHGTSVNMPINEEVGVLTFKALACDSAM
jgi:hypothetical protein